MSQITVTTGSAGSIEVAVSQASIGLPALSIGAGNNINISESNGTRVISGTLNLASAAPSNLGTAAVGTSAAAAREDHVHAMPSLGGLADVTLTSPSSGEVLTWNGTTWAAAAAAAANGSLEALNNLTGSVTLVGGNSINVATDGQNITLNSNLGDAITAGRNIEVSSSDGGISIGTISNYLDIAQQPNLRDLKLLQTADGTQHFFWSANDEYREGFTLEVVEVGLPQNISDSGTLQTQADGSFDIAVEKGTSEIRYVTVFASQNLAEPSWELVDFESIEENGNQAVIQGLYLPQNFTSPGAYPVYVAFGDPGGVLVGATTPQNATVFEHGSPLPPEILSFSTSDENISVVVGSEQTPHELGFYGVENIAYYAEVTENAATESGWTRGPGVSGPRAVEVLSVPRPQNATWSARVLAENPLGEGPPSETTP